VSAWRIHSAYPNEGPRDRSAQHPYIPKGSPVAKVLIEKAKNISPVKQINNMTCWLACYQMMRDWQGKDTSEDAIKTKLTNNLINWDDAYATGLKGKDFKTAAMAMDFTHYPGGGMTMNVITRMYLSGGSGPVWVAGVWKKDVKHIKLLVGYDEEGADGGGVYVIDPWYPPEPSVSYEPLSSFAAGHNVYDGVPGAIQIARKA
jgi:hypothetical protein